MKLKFEEEKVYTDIGLLKRYPIISQKLNIALY